jgi:hypothetical protein
VLTPLFRRMMARLQQSDRWYVAIFWLLACAFGADWAGLHHGRRLPGRRGDGREWFGQENLDALFKTCCWY